ncbi:hypothetical protein D6829_00840 [Candidatus Pacearchaeota archaeon]|nr:MAG: hypothetical protein D6829_00840 [Candidatus Pacearchaeota archaeon]
MFINRKTFKAYDDEIFMRSRTLLFILLLAMVINLASLFYTYSLLDEKIESLRPKVVKKSLEVESKPFQVVEKSIPIVAVSSEGKGVVSNLKVKIIPGNNNVLINTNPFLEADIQYSANKAVAVAKLNSDYDYDKDFIFDFEAKGAQLIGGESAGAAIAIVTMAALQGKAIKNDSVITGTINPDGSIGRIGGVMEKAKAVADAGYKYFLVPKGQAKVTYYEKQVVKEPFGFGFEILNTRYIPKKIDLKKIAKSEWGLEVVEVSNINEAAPYFFA